MSAARSKASYLRRVFTPTNAPDGEIESRNFFLDFPPSGLLTYLAADSLWLLVLWRLTMPNTLPEVLAIAQAAVQLPEVQDMMRKLSKYHLGVCMPHMHDEKDWGLQVLPEGMTQVEDKLRISFQPTNEVPEEFYISVAWVWRDGATPGVAVCSNCYNIHH